MTTDVFLTRTAAFLPFAPVSNEDIEEVLGRVGDRVSRARRLILRSNGIRSRHYAIDRATGLQAMSNAELTAAAIRGLGTPEELGRIDCLVTGTSMPDQLMPNHAVMVHGELGWPRLEVVACAGICLAGAELSANVLASRLDEVADRRGEIVPATGFDQLRHEIAKAQAQHRSAPSSV